MWCYRMILLCVSLFFQVTFCSSALYQGVFGYYYLSHITHELSLVIEDPAKQLWLISPLLISHTPLGQIHVSCG